MDFERVLRDLASDFNERDVPYAMIGGFALGVLGIQRATMDLDFLVARDALAQVDEIMQRRGYRLRFRSENVSQFVSDSASLGEIDWERMREYFALFGRLELYEGIRRSHGPADCG